MSKFLINPKSGSIKDSSSVKWSLSDLPQEARRVRFENVTHGSDLGIFGIESRGEIKGEIDLKIPEHSSHAAISVYAFLEAEEKDGWKVVEILPAFYDVSSEKISYDGKLNLSTHFAGPTELIEIEIQDKPNDKYIVSINDRQFVILTANDGVGTYSFSGSDVIEKEPGVLFKYPVYVRTADDEFESKKFTGSYVHILPKLMEMMADCTPFDIESSCLPSLEEQSPLTTQYPISPKFPTPPDGSLTDEDDCKDVSLVSSAPCRIDNYSMTILPNNTVVYAYVGRDKGEQNNTVRLGFDKTTNSKRALPLRYGVVSPDDDRILLLVEPDIWNMIDVAENWKISLRHPDFNFETYDIDELLPPDPYTAAYRITLVPKTGDSTSLNYFCMPFVALNNESNNEGAVNGLPSALPEIETAYGDKTTATGVSIAASRTLLHDNSTTYIYVIAEAPVYQTHQLFMYSMKVQASDKGDSFSDTETYGWVQLTDDGENKNPKAVCDDAGNLNVFWESSRTGEASQIYYGVLGPQAFSLANAAFSSALDKQIDVIKNHQSTEYNSYPIAKELGEPDDYVITQLCDDLNPSTLPQQRWMAYENGDGDVTVTDNSTIRIVGNASSDHAMAFTTFDEDILGNKFTGLWSQISFGLGFDLSDNAATSVLSDSDIDDLFLLWKDGYTILGSDDYKNQNIYTKSNNRFLLGKTDRYFDRFIPVAGSYKNIGLDSMFSECRTTADENFSVVGSGCNATLKHFMLGIMPEKVRFRATNIDTFQEYCDNTGGSISSCVDSYIGDSDTIHYTGRYKLCLLLNADGRFFGGQERRGYTLSREIGDPFTLTRGPRISVDMHYRKMLHEDNNVWSGAGALATHINKPKAMASIIVAIRGDAVFSESFLVDMTDGRRKFDIGIGLPYSGQFITREFLPYETIIYEDLDVDFNFDNVDIGNSTWSKGDGVTVPRSFKDVERVFSEDTTSEVFPKLFEEEYGWLNLGFNKLQFFPQIPITFDGVNKGVSACLGPYCNDIHLAWQTNRTGRWDIVYTSSTDRAMPFRFDTMITKTDSNSLMPAVAIDGDGRRLITWHDNRDGVYQIYAAKGAAGDTACDVSDCELYSGVRIVGAPDFFDPDEEDDVCRIEFVLCNEPCDAYYELQTLDACSTLEWCDPVTCAYARTSPGPGNGWTPPLPDPDDAHVVLQTHDTTSAPACATGIPGYYSTTLCTPKGYNRRVQCSRLFVYKCATHDGNKYTFIPSSKVILKTGWRQNGNAPDATSGPFYSNGPASGTLLDDKPYWFAECGATGIGGWATTSSFLSSLLESDSHEGVSIREAIYNAASAYLGGDLPAANDAHTIIMHILFHRFAGQPDSDSRVELARIYTFDCLP